MTGSFYNEKTDTWLIPVSGQMLKDTAGVPLIEWSEPVQFRFEEGLDGWSMVIRIAEKATA